MKTGVGVKLKKICEFLDSELRIKDIPDASLNGLQIEGCENIEKIAFAVDGSYETFVKAVEASCRLLIVHHGLFWGKCEPITGLFYKKLKVLIENGVSLYAVHLPLDLHPRFGNNIQIMKLFTDNALVFGEYQGQEIGFSGRLSSPLNMEEIVKKLNNTLNTSSKILSFGKEEIGTIAVVSGSGCDCLKEAIDKKIDLFITGEAKLFSWHLAKEGKINIIFSGHYATETVGLKALMEEIKKIFNIPCEFLDVPCWI